MPAFTKDQAKNFARLAKASVGRDVWNYLKPDQREAIVAREIISVILGNARDSDEFEGERFSPERRAQIEVYNALRDLWRDTLTEATRVPGHKASCQINLEPSPYDCNCGATKPEPSPDEF
jgi:hypothetical protein